MNGGRNGDGAIGGNNTASSMHSAPAMASMALALTSQEWMQLGHGDIPNVAASTDLTITANRVLALFVVRIVALISHRQFIQGRSCPYADLSTTTICQTDLATAQKNWEWPIPQAVVEELHTYIQRIFQQYKHVSYHNFEHAYHVIISANKLLDLMLHHDQDRTQYKTYGLKSDPLSHLALLFSALVHDVEHQGVPNRQLVLESDRLALLYNDQSVAEQRSLAVAFAELTGDEYRNLRGVLFPDVQEYRRFRKTVINLVLTTDIASPERTQIVKSKWKEAFGEKKDVAEVRVDIVQMDQGRDEEKNEGNAMDDTSDASTSVTPESCEGLDNVFGTSASPLTGGSRSVDSSRMSGGGISSSLPPQARSAASSPPQESILSSLPSLSQDMGTMNRAVSSEDGRRNRESSDLHNKRAARRFSMPSSGFDMKKAHVRLGIRRSLDLTGEAIEPYIIPSVVRSVKPASVCSLDKGSSSDSELTHDADDPDELRASVVMEQLLKAADVSGAMQGWDQLEKWSGRLFFELMDSFAAGRGDDPRQGWYQNQITFLESYMLPLARRLHVTQVFGNTIGPMFARTVEENRDRWISEGVVLTAQVTQKWIRQNQRSTTRGEDT